jgi:hypothetical protein
MLHLSDAGLTEDRFKLFHQVVVLSDDSGFFIGFEAKLRRECVALLSDEPGTVRFGSDLLLKSSKAHFERVAAGGNRAEVILKAGDSLLELAGPAGAADLRAAPKDNQQTQGAERQTDAVHGEAPEGVHALYPSSPGKTWLDRVRRRG